MKTTKKSAIILSILLLFAALFGCGKAAKKPVLLVVSFGTSYNDSRDLTIGAIEKSLQTAYPDYEIRRAFTSQIIIDKLKERDNLAIDNVTEAMERLVADGVSEVLIQPTHVMNGYEYDDVVSEVSKYSDKFKTFAIGKSMLSSDDDYAKMIAVLTDELSAYNNDDTAIVLMGHGTNHPANSTYATLQSKLNEAGRANFFVGTVEAEPSVEEVLSLVQASGAKKVVLTPLMIVCGDHGNNDMAGDEPDSWKSIFTAAGYEVECVLKGLGEYEGIQKLVVEHAGSMMAK